MHSADRMLFHICTALIDSATFAWLWQCYLKFILYLAQRYRRGARERWYVHNSRWPISWSRGNAYKACGNRHKSTREDGNRTLTQNRRLWFTARWGCRVREAGGGGEEMGRVGRGEEGGSDSWGPEVTGYIGLAKIPPPRFRGWWAVISPRRGKSELAVGGSGGRGGGP
jgi:hypothetical protein